MLGEYLITVVTSDTKLSTLEPIIYKYVEKDSDVWTDEHYRHSNLSKRYNHKMVNHSAKPKQYKNGEVTTNSIEGV
jgi:ISXO2-like transposase domain